MMRNLPQKNYSKTVLKFKDLIVCNLNLLLNGLDENKLTKEQEAKVKLTECPHGSWPPISKACESCIVKNSPERYLEDKKGRQFRVLK